MRYAVLTAAVLAMAAAAPARGDDEVIYWNNVLLQGFRTDFGQGCPCPLARAGAMVQGAVYDAVNSIERTHTAYLGFVEVTTPASEEAAAAAAAHRTMLNVFPNSQATLDSDYAARLALIPDGPAKTNGVAVGEAVGSRMVAARAHDGSQVHGQYVFGNQPGDYRPTPPGFNPICNPEWVTVTPFCMDRGDQYRSNGPLGFRNMDLLLRSPRYAHQVNEVKVLGALNSPTRTDEQPRIAFFWAVDVNGTCKPPGQLFQIAQAISADRHLNLPENARLMALVALAMGDAGIVAWDMKYGTPIDLWRPITAIRLADTDHNPHTTADPAWEPLNSFTPPFPTYVSGHATFAAAACSAMAGFLGTDHVTFTLASEDPFYNALPSHPTRTFHRLSDAAWENALSRVYLGVHFRMDAVDGNSAGTALGRSVVQHFLLPLCPADFDGNGRVDTADLLAFLEAFNARSPSADFNHDAQVNILDLLGFLDAMRHGCP
jgi:hypothetical protein